MTDLQAQCEAQERLILSLRAQKAELQARVANLQRMHDHDQRMIGVLQRKLRDTKKSEVEQVFGGGQ